MVPAPTRLSTFDIAGRAMSAQLVRLNTVASNLANAGTVAGSANAAYRAMRPVFRTVEDGPGIATVTVDRIDASSTPAVKRHAPDNPLADANGDVWDAGVDPAAEMIDMIDAARQYQSNVQVLDTAKTLALDTLRIGQ